jgi:HEAT repeat protein
MEESLAQLADSMDYLMERGQLPLSATKLQDLARRFADISLPDQDRLRALRLLERNGGLTDDLVLQAVGWLQTSPNARTRRDLLRQMDDLDHETLKAPMLGLLSTETDSNVREELVDNLGRFASDPQVEAQLWDVMNNDPDPEVREEAEDALRREPMSRERVASLQDRALSPDATMEERLLAIQATQRQDEKSPEFMAVMGELVQLTQDPVDRARMFRAFDGTTDPALKQPLLNGLQDPSPVVREEAVDALSDYRDDPAIDQWLRYLMDNDPDPRVQREAFNTISNRD